MKTTAQFIEFLRSEKDENDATFLKSSTRLNENFLYYFSWNIEEMFKTKYASAYIGGILEVIDRTDKKATDEEVIAHFVDQHKRMSINFFNGTNVISNLENMWKYQVQHQLFESILTSQP